MNNKNIPINDKNSIISCVVWDWNGTVVDDTFLCYDIYCVESRQYHLRVLTLEGYRDLFHFPVRDFYIEMGLAEQEYAAVANAFSSQYRNRWQEISLQPGVEKMMRQFADQGVVQLVLSAYRQDELQAMVDYFGLGHYFRFVAGIATNSAGSKLERGREIFKQLECETQNIIMIGDSVHDAEVARALGITPLLISRGHASPKQLLRCCPNVPLFSSLDEAYSVLF